MHIGFLLQINKMFGIYHDDHKDNQRTILRIHQNALNRISKMISFIVC